MAEFLPNLPGKISFILPQHHSRLLCFYAGQRQLKAVRDSITQYWTKGLDSEKTVSPICTQFKLHDSPFHLHDTSANAVAVMKLYTGIINRYYRYGWKLVTGAILTDRYCSDPMLIFRKVINPSSYPIVSIGMCCFHVHLENAPQELSTNVEELMVDHLKHEIKHSVQDSDTSTTFKLKGLKGLGEHETWMFVQNLLTVLQNKHYVIYGSLPLHYHVFDMLFFQYLPNPQQEQEHFTMVLKGSDTLQLYYSEVRVNNAIVEIIETEWEGGCKKKYKEDNDCLELKLKGNPFDASTHEKTLPTDVLFCSLLKKLASVDYYVTSSFMQSGDEKQVFFRKGKREATNVRFLCLAITDRAIRFVNAPQEIYEATTELVEEMRLEVKEDHKVTAGCTHEVVFKKHGILYELDGSEDHYQARCLIASLLGRFTELRYNFVVCADFHLPRQTKHFREKSKSWFFMFDEEDVAVKQHLRVESLSRSPSPHRHSAHGSPNRSPRHHHQHHHYSHRSSPRLSPRRFRGEASSPTATHDAAAPFLHSGEIHFLPSPLVDAPPPSYEETVGMKPP